MEDDGKTLQWNFFITDTNGEHKSVHYGEVSAIQKQAYKAVKTTFVHKLDLCIQNVYYVTIVHTVTQL